MVSVVKIEARSKTQVRRFVNLPFRLYAQHSLWVPPLRMDVELMLNRQKHPYYEHSDADFFIASRDGRDVGRVAALENRRFNDYHKMRQAQFYLFECENDPEAASALFGQVCEWAGREGWIEWSAPICNSRSAAGDAPDEVGGGASCRSFRGAAATRSSIQRWKRPSANSTSSTPT